MNDLKPTLTPQEWIEYYRFHPSEFENFIKFVEELNAAQAARIEELEAMAAKANVILDEITADALDYAKMDSKYSHGNGLVTWASLNKARAFLGHRVTK